MVTRIGRRLAEGRNRIGGGNLSTPLENLTCEQISFRFLYLVSRMFPIE